MPTTADVGILRGSTGGCFATELTGWEQLTENLTPERLGYSSAMLLSVMVFLLVRRFQPKSPAVAALPWQQRVALTWAALVGGAFGAKIGFALATHGNWLQAGTWLTDGKTITTGLLGAYLAVELVKLLLHIPVKTGDSYALPLAFALAVGRWGCFFNGCCYGQPTALPWGVDFGDAVRRHPTQIYESLFHLGIAGVLLLLIGHDALRNQRLKFYLITYGCYRFLSEYIRPESDWGLGLTFYQWVSLVIIIGLSMQWWLDRRSSEKTPTMERVAIP